MALPPRLLRLDTCAEIIYGWRNEWLRETFPDYAFIGSNAGLESIALDCRRGKPGPIVMINRIAGPDSAQIIAQDAHAFVEAIGLKYEDRLPNPYVQPPLV